MNILIVEDNERLYRALIKGLHEAGHTTDHASHGRDGIFLAATGRYDVIVVDRVLPGTMDGLTVIGTLRKTGSKVPILILSALSEVDDRIMGLKAGGDDYLTKPFVFGELIARLEALARRVQQAYVETVLKLDDLRMDLLSRTVSRDGTAIPLKPREFKLLEYLLRHANQVVTRTMLLESVWSYDFDPQTNVVEVHISKLRQKIDAVPGRPLLHTIRKSGYMLGTFG